MGWLRLGETDSVAPTGQRHNRADSAVGCSIYDEVAAFV